MSIFSCFSKKQKSCVSFCVFSLTGHQLLSRSRGPGCDNSRAERAHNAANHFPHGTGSWGKVPYQVIFSENLISSYSWFPIGGKKREERGKNESEVGEGSQLGTSEEMLENDQERGENRKAVCLLVAQNVYEINADSVAWKRRRRIDPLSQSAPDYTLLFVIANSSLKITIWPSTLRCFAAG